MRETWIRSLGWEDPLEKGKTSGLEHAVDCIVHGVAKSRTQLSDFCFTLLLLGFQREEAKDSVINKGS